MKRAIFLILTAIIILLFPVFTTVNVIASNDPLRTFSNPVDGSWTGTTSLAKAMSFTVGSGGTQWSSFALTTSFYASNCSASVTTTLTYPGPGSITNGSFSYMNGTATYSFYGQFDSPYTASGTYAFTNYKFDIFNGFSHCYYYLTQSGTWSASVPPPPPGAFDKITPTDGATGQSINPTLSWGSSSDASYYEYCYSKSNPCTDWTTNNTAMNIELNGLEENMTYYWNVRAVNVSGTVYANGSETDWSFTTGTLPGGFEKATPADGATGQSIHPTLSWGSSSDASYYEYCYSKSNPCTDWTTNNTAMNIELNGLEENMTYYWNVRATNGTGTVYANGSETDWSFTTGTLPGGFEKATPADGATGQSINPTMSWGSSSGASSFEYCYSKTNPCADWISNSTTTSVDLNGLEENTAYYWNVRATNGTGTVYADGSETDWLFTTGALPGAFDKISPTYGASGQPIKPTLSWESSSDASYYEYCYGTENPCTDWKSNNTATSVVLPVLAENTTYYWNVRAVNLSDTVYANGSETDWSFTTGILPGAFNMLTPADGASNRPANQKLTWSASAGATSYSYCIDKTNDGKCNVWVNNGSATTKTLSGLLPNTTYYWHVKAVNDVGATYSNGALAILWAFKTGLKPAAFSKTAPANGALNLSINPTLRWDASTGATYYQYCISKVNPCTKWVKLGKVTSVALSGLLPKTKYYWQVRAVNTFGVVYANATTADWSFKTK